MSVTLIPSETKIAGAKIGESVLIHLVTGKIEKVLFDARVVSGIEGFNLELTSKPLTFYPYTSIIKVTKYTELT